MKSRVAVLVLLLVLVIGFWQNAEAASPVHVSVLGAPVPVGSKIHITYYVEPSYCMSCGTATVYIRPASSSGHIWNSAGITISGGIAYDAYAPGISTSGYYIAGVVVITVAGAAVLGESSKFLVIGSAPAFDFSLVLSPSSVNVKAGGTATFQVLLTYSDPSYSGTTINVVVSGMGPGMNYQLIPSPPTLQVFTSPSTPPGTYSITVTGSANGKTHQATGFVLVTPPTQSFDFSIAASPSSLTLMPGGTATYTASVTLVSGNAQAVSLTVSGLPPGITSSFNPTSGAPSFSSTLTVSVSSSASPGTFALTILGNGGAVNHQTTVTLIVVQAPQLDFQIAVNPTSLTATQGQSVSYTVSVVAINGFNSQVALSVSGLPGGASGAFSPSAGAPNFISTFTVTVPGSVPPGSYPLTVTGLGNGLTRSATATLTINAAPQTSSVTTSQTSSSQSAQSPGFYVDYLIGLAQQNWPLVLGGIIILLAAIALGKRKPHTSGQGTGSP